MSAPHIYHSALALSPQTSLVYGKYKKYVHPLVRVVHGFPVSWEPAIATLYLVDLYRFCWPVWSPCNRFIAIGGSGVVEIRDAVTFNLLNTLKSPLDSDIKKLRFSPDSHFLAQFNQEGIVSWDLQTGGPVGIILLEGLYMDYDFSSTYSLDGGTLAAVFHCDHRVLDEESLVKGFQVGETLYSDNTFIVTYDLSGPHRHLCHVSEGWIIPPIWTHCGSLRFATVKLGYIIIWEAAFTLRHTPKVIESLPIPDETSNATSFLFLPVLSRLAAACQDTLFVWDAKVSKLLLNSGPLEDLDLENTDQMSFSLDGHLFVCMVSVRTGEICVWKEYPNGYMLHQRIVPKITFVNGPILSPNEKSIITIQDSTMYLQHTQDQILPLPGVKIPTCYQNSFILEFSPNEALASFTRLENKTVVILDLQLGDPQLVIDTSMEVRCLKMTGDTIIILGKDRIAAWNLPGESARVNINDSVGVTQLWYPSPSQHLLSCFWISISPELSYMAIYDGRILPQHLAIYNLSTGRHLTSTEKKMDEVAGLWFTLDGCEIWGFNSQDSPIKRWGIIGGGGSVVTKLCPLV